MRRLRKVLGSMLLLCAICLFSTVSVSAAEVEIVMKNTPSANTGDTVYAQVILNGNPGISTMGIRMTYDADVLTYEGETWHKQISDNSRNMSLVSDIEEGGENILNISTILDSTYKVSGEAIVTVKFTAKQSFSSMPVTLEARDVTDGNYENVTVKIAKGTISSDSSDDKNSSSESQANDSESQTGTSSSQQTGNSSVSGSNNNSGAGTSGSSNSGNSNLDNTFKTGAVDIRIVLGALAVVLVGVAAVCIKVLRIRKY